MERIYGLFGFDFHLELSTRPDNYLGTVETWDAAEAVYFLSFLCRISSLTALSVATEESFGKAIPW